MKLLMEFLMKGFGDRILGEIAEIIPGRNLVKIPGGILLLKFLEEFLIRPWQNLGEIPGGAPGGFLVEFLKDIRQNCYINHETSFQSIPGEDLKKTNATLSNTSTSLLVVDDRIEQKST